MIVTIELTINPKPTVDQPRAVNEDEVFHRVFQALNKNIYVVDRRPFSVESVDKVPCTGCAAYKDWKNPTVKPKAPPPAPVAATPPAAPLAAPPASAAAPTPVSFPAPAPVAPKEVVKVITKVVYRTRRVGPKNPARYMPKGKVSKKKLKR